MTDEKCQLSHVVFQCFSLYIDEQFVDLLSCFCFDQTGSDITW